MSLSRPVKFPLLKLPFLCIKCVIHNSDLFAVIYFATISKRTRRIVQHSKYPLKEIDVAPRRYRWISLEKGNEKAWYFMDHMRGNGVPLNLHKNSEPFLTSECFDSNRGNHLHSYTAGDTLDALKMGIAFLIDVFGCKIRKLFGGDELSEHLRLGISSVKELVISDEKPVNITQFKNLVETIKVTDEYVFFVPIPKDFYCDPQIFKCRQLYFGHVRSAAWVTSEVLCQFDVPILSFPFYRFSVNDIVSFITHWFNSEGRKLEYASIAFNNPVLEDFKIDHLNPMPFCEKRRNRWTLHESWEKADLSRGKDILRKDGLLATLHAYQSSIFFYVWHKRFPDAFQK